MTTNFKRRARRRHLPMSTTDRAFDELVPAELRHLSHVHWTPVDIAIRAARLLAPSRGTRVLDVGSGVGKLCAVGALSSAAMWCGVEMHAPLVMAARRLTRALGISHRTMFLHADALSIEWTEFEAVYLYNPFEIPVVALGVPVQPPIDYRIQVARVQQRLAALGGGTRVVTLHGFGGVMPASYELVYHERLSVIGLDLVLWVQRSNGARESS
jgi:hypothetical protein